MILMFPEIKFKDCDHRIAKKLKNDLLSLKEPILDYSPLDFNKGKLDRIRVRVFKFPRKETCNEFFIIIGNKKYVCINSSLLKNRYYSGLQHALHGIAHHFSHFRNEISDEVFCEFVSYSVLKEMLENKGKKFQRRIIRSVMRSSPKEYNIYYRIARKLDEKEEDALLKLNFQAKNRKISKVKEKKIFSRLLKTKIHQYDYVIKEMPELENGFRKV
ncbi:MAG: hypothetical protein GW914_01250 [Candidatus Aenigmarchaeota archaeon]|nr:hypothetical protein [Candidatus Aenigmarchaeota archaeon]